MQGIKVSTTLRNIDDLIAFYQSGNDEIIDILQEIKAANKENEFFYILEEQEAWDSSELLDYVLDNKEALLAELNILSETDLFYDLVQAQEAMNENDSDVEEHGDWRLEYNTQDNCVDVYYQNNLILKANYHTRTYQTIDNKLIPIDKLKTLLGISNLWRS